MATVRANDSIICRHPDGYPVTVVEDQPFDSSDPLVRKYPWLFAADDVEAASAAPGEKRNVRSR